MRKYLTKTFTTYYERLGIKSTASKEEIKQRYYELAKKYHPDMNLNKESLKQLGQNREMFREINEAFKILSDEKERKKYDSGQTVVFKNQNTYEKYRDINQENEHQVRKRSIKIFETPFFSVSPETEARFEIKTYLLNILSFLSFYKYTYIMIFFGLTISAYTVNSQKLL